MSELSAPLGFYAKAPIATWNQRLGVDFPGVFKAVLKASIDAPTGNALGAIGNTIEGLFAFKLEDVQRPPEELAWLLTQRSLARAMAELTVETARRSATDLESAQVAGLVQNLDAALAEAEIWIDPAFFDRPGHHAVLPAVAPHVRAWLKSFGLKDAEAASAERRLASYFTLALRREWAEHAETYAALEAALKAYDNRFAKADQRERAWIRNADYLQRLIQEPVFEESFGLDDVFVPLRAWYQEETQAAGRRRSEMGAPDQEKAKKTVVDLEAHLNAWLADGDPKDAIRVICGGPGCGKTSFAKIWAAKLASEGRRVLFIPLHHIDLEQQNAQQAIADYVRFGDILPFDPLDPIEGEARLLLLFDGLDELAMQGRAGQEVARTFVEGIDRKLGAINDRGERLVQVVFGGRNLAVEAAESVLRGRRVLHVLPYHGTAAGNFDEGTALLEDERFACDRWWERFGTATGEGYTAIPEPLQADELAEITAQPLLNYLVALSYRRGKLDFEHAHNLNEIYADLLDAVYDRPWGPSGHPTTKPLERTVFFDLLEEIGLAAWHGSGRTITETEVEVACKRAGLEEELKRFQEGTRPGAISLLAAFYFRQAGRVKGGERTFEFTHKSFSEYLAMRRLVRLVGDLDEERCRSRQERRRARWNPEAALIEWGEATGPAEFDLALKSFFDREIRRAGTEGADVGSWHATLVELFNDQLQHGLPMHKFALKYQEMARQARNAEEALLAAVHACAAAVNCERPKEKEPVRTVFRWPDRILGPRDLLARLDQGVGASNVARSCFAWLTLSGAGLGWSNLVRANLEGANLIGTDLEGADLKLAKLEGADLVGANLFGAALEGADLKRATMDASALPTLKSNGIDPEMARIVIIPTPERK